MALASYNGTLIINRIRRLLFRIACYLHCTCAQLSRW